MTVQTPWDELQDLLRERAKLQESEAIEAQIHQRFGRECAIMITDMEGFSRRTRDHGIIDVLQLIGRMTDLCQPVLDHHGGTLIKIVGDDLLAIFDTAESAVRAAVGMRRACEDDRAGRSESERIRIAAGIGWGYLLDLDGTDVFGDEVNRASKLGEDLAGAGEILVTHAARERLPEAEWRLEKRATELSGMTFEHFCVHPLEDT
jgi:adenylate cyclase